MNFYAHSPQNKESQNFQEKKDLSSISKITNNIYLSGVMPMELNPGIIREYDIKYILCCVKKKNVLSAHNKIMMENPNIIILYLPYDDMLYQNLWRRNNDTIDIYKYNGSIYDNTEIENRIKLYTNRPLIEIGYHFINDAISSRENILIHCMAGISRSVSLVTYYLMKKFGVGFDQTFNFIKSRREIADPNSSFKHQLKTYENLREKFNENYADNIIKRLV
uniref:Tyrosine specific protein phosphatases domain-containing protein n=1 Tax=viral metagenome TaxID=1070528 RepID=A0A6C0C9U7_9ZZZZ